MRALVVFVAFACATALQLTADTLPEDSAYWEAEYQRVALLASDDAMNQYIRRFVAHEGNTVTSATELQGLVPWYSGTKRTQSFAALTEELASKSWVVPASGAAKPRGTASPPSASSKPQFAKEKKEPPRQPQMLAATSHVKTDASSLENRTDGAKSTSGVKQATRAIGNAFHSFARAATSKVGQAKQAASKAAHGAQHIIGNSLEQAKEAASSATHRAQLLSSTVETVASESKDAQPHVGQADAKAHSGSTSSRRRKTASTKAKASKTLRRRLSSKHDAKTKTSERAVVKTSKPAAGASHAQPMNYSSISTAHAAENASRRMVPTAFASVTASSVPSLAAVGAEQAANVSSSGTQTSELAAGSARPVEAAPTSAVHEAQVTANTTPAKHPSGDESDSVQRVDTRDTQKKHTSKNHSKHEPMVVNESSLATGGDGKLSQLIEDMRTMLNKSRHHNLVAIAKQRESFEAILKQQQANITAMEQKHQILLNETEGLEKSNDKLRAEAQVLRQVAAKLEQQLLEIRGNLSTAKDFIDTAMPDDAENDNKTYILRKLDEEEAAAMFERAHKSALAKIDGKKKLAFIQVHDVDQAETFIRSMRKNLQSLESQRAASEKYLQEQFEAEFARGSEAQRKLEEEQQSLSERQAAALELRDRLEAAIQKLEQAKDFLQSRVASLKKFSKVLAQS